MGKRGKGDRTVSNLPCGSHKVLSLREEKAGKRQTNTANVKSKLKLEHLQRLAVWASGEASIPSLAALFGHRLACANAALGLQPDSSLFSCQRCETILQPGFNCSIRIEKNKLKARHGSKKPKTSTENRVVYKCHFCSHHNLKRGTPEGHMKEIYPRKAKPPLKPERLKSPLEKFINLVKDTRIKDEVSKADEIALPAIAGDSAISSSPMTPLVKTKLTLEGKKRRRSKPGTQSLAESESNSAATDTGKTISASTKRKRNSWTSLKEIAERSEHDNGQNSQTTTNLAVPFSL